MVSVNAQLGFIEYIVCLDHRESWAYWSQVRTSQSDLMGVGVALAKKLDIVYKHPTLPINLNVQPKSADHILNEMIPVNPLPPMSPIADGVKEANSLGSRCIRGTFKIWPHSSHVEIHPATLRSVTKWAFPLIHGR